jgi:hypothetical protein
MVVEPEVNENQAGKKAKQMRLYMIHRSNPHFILILALALVFSGCHLLMDIKDNLGSEVEVCDNGKDDDGDGFIDCNDSDCDTNIFCNTNNINNLNNTNNLNNLNNTNNVNNTNNTTPEVDCANSIDDDGDGATDCDDTDCVDDPACAPVECDDTTFYFDTATAACVDGFYCSLNSAYAPTCVAESASEGGTYYGACGTAKECPVGSFCLNSRCLPFCNTTSHPDCPMDGICLYTWEETGYNLCESLETCTIFPDSCPDGKSCYSADQTAFCFDTGTVLIDETCENTQDCAPGGVCITSDHKCHLYCRIAEGDTDCNDGDSCVSISHPLYGACI